jgi:hypothetical protein
MSESNEDFEFISASDVVSSSRGRRRKPKYQTQPWLDKSFEGRNYMMNLLRRSEQRRTGNNETSYDHLIDPEWEYIQWWIDNTPHYGYDVYKVCWYCNRLYELQRICDQLDAEGMEYDSDYIHGCYKCTKSELTRVNKYKARLNKREVA